MTKLRQFDELYGSLLWLLFSLGLLFAVIYPIFTYEYLFNDDWQHFLGTYPYFYKFLGRYFGGVIVCFQFKLFHHIGDAYIARGVTFVGLAVLLIVIYVFLRREYFPRYLSAFVAFGCVTLPGALISAFWLSAGYIIFSLLASVFSALLCQLALGQEVKDRRFYVLILTAILIEIASALIYQIGAMMFLVFAAVAISRTLKADDRLVFRSSLMYGGIFAAANLSYFVYFKYFVANEVTKIDPARGLLFDDLGSGFVWFIQTALPRASQLWFIETSTNWVPLIVCLIFIASLFLYIYSLFCKNFSRRTVLLTFAYVMTIFLLGLGCFLPVLVSNYRWNVFRNLTPLSSFIFSITCIQLWLGFRGEKHENEKAFFLIMPMMIFIAFFSHNILLTKMVLPKSVEVQYLKNTMQAAKMSGGGNLPVHAIIPQIKELWDTEEIGFLNASFFHFGILQIMVDRIRDELKLPNVNVTHSMAAEDFNPKGKVIVDLSVLANTGIAGSFEHNFPIYVKDKPVPASQIATRYMCPFCGYIYDPVKGDPEHNIIPGTKFEDLPESWRCPVCRSHK